MDIQPGLSIADEEIEWTAVRAQGAGGQHVNKASTAVHLRFDSRRSSLSDEVKARLLSLRDARIGRDGVVVIKAQRHRSQERNREDALERLRVLILKAMEQQKPRRATRPSRAAKKKRLDSKGRRSEIKQARRSPLDH